MREPQQPTNDNPFDPKASLNFMTFLAAVHSKMTGPFLRSGAGTDCYTGRDLAFAFFAYPLIADSAGAPEVYSLWLAWVVLVVFRKLTPDRTQHTRYWGRPWLLRAGTLWLMPQWLELAAEPFFMLLLGNLIAPWSATAGRIFAFGVVTHTFANLVAWQDERRARAAVHNARVQAEWVNRY